MPLGLGLGGGLLMGESCLEHYFCSMNVTDMP